MKISIILIGIMMTLSAPVRGQEDPGYISIDCGAPKEYYDDTVNIYYQTDANFTDTGKNMPLPSQAYENYNQQSQELRAFPNGTRNCYTLRPKQGSKNTYLVRALFLYGNYDGKDQTPVFHLYIDTNYWATVNFTGYTYQEVIYIAPRDYIQVCLVNIGSGVPFISALELRLLDNSIYKIPSLRALYTNWRLNIGSNKTIRHPQDDYDRFWASQIYPDSKSLTNTTPIATPTSSNAYKVPEDVLMTAQETSSLNESFRLFWKSKPGASWYVYFHFAEVQDLKGQVREMDIYVKSRFTETIRLQNQVPLTVVQNFTEGIELDFTLNATAQSTLPPLINALEFYTVLDLPYVQTDLNDYVVLNAIKTTYGIVKDSWQGDPCVPPSMVWDGLSCSYDNNAPGIISLNLSSSNLTGSITNLFSNLTGLTSLDLSNNQLTGEIPEVLAKLLNLRVLNLTGNNLSGSLPKAIMERVNAKTLQLSLDSNATDFNTTIITEGGNKSKIVFIVAPVSGLALLIFFCVAGLFWWRIKKRRKQVALYSSASTRPSSESKWKTKNRPFTYNEVSKITNNFETIIGEGGFGKVYLGILANGEKVAVKMFSPESSQGYKEYEAEAKLLMVTYHRNLVSLVGYCDDIRNMALIYEYMAAGNLKERLSGKNPIALSWIQRLIIAVDAAEGLNYLHHGCKPPIIHRDLKASNILLNEDMQAKIADFGLSKVFRNESKSYISTCPAGTPGYLDPEFQSTGNSSKKSDVYSFGIILFELITGHSAFLRGPNGKKHILKWVTPFIEKGDIASIMDPRLEGQFSVNSAWKVVEIAMSCVPPTAIQRPTIADVLQELKECLKVETSGSLESVKIATPELDLDVTPSPR